MVARIAIFVPGRAVLSSSNDRPSSYCVTTTSCFPPDFVLIIPVAPSLSGPSSLDSFMSGFHSGQWLTSDQTRHTVAGEAAVSSEASRNAMVILHSAIGTRRHQPYAGQLIWKAGQKLLREIGKSTRLNSSHTVISYAVFCLKKK